MSSWRQLKHLNTEHSHRRVLKRVSILALPLCLQRPKGDYGCQGRENGSSHKTTQLQTIIENDTQKIK